MPSKLKRKRVPDPDIQSKQVAIDESSTSDDSEGDENFGSTGSLSKCVAGDKNCEDAWTGIDAGLGDRGSNTVGQPIGSKLKSHSLPSGEELRVMKDAANLFRSQSFKLQIDALLPNVRPDPSKIPPLDRFLFDLHTFLNSIPSVSPEHPLQASRRLLSKGIAIPYCLPLPTEDTNWKVAFDVPSDISLVGSWANRTCIKGKDGTKFGVDLAVEMPLSLFQDKDYLNGRFFQKKAFYLATIAEAIKFSTSVLCPDVDAFYDCTANDIRLTNLVLCPRKSKAAKAFSRLNAHVRIILTSSLASPVVLHRLSPSHANVRTSVSMDGSSKNGDLPTPLYNNALLTSFAPKLSLLSTHALIQDVAGFSDALVLLKVWANQRGYGNGTRSCVRGFEGRGPWWSAVLRLLLIGAEQPEAGTKRKLFGRRLSSYQLFKAALDFLATHDFPNEPIFLKAEDDSQIPFQEFRENYEVSFIDSLPRINLLAGVPPSSLEMLRYDAQKSLEQLDHAPINCDPFIEIFLKDKRNLCSRFDTVIRIDLSAAKERKQSLPVVVDWSSPAAALLASLASVIRHGLGNRAIAIALLHSTSEPRPTSQAHPISPSIVHIGLVHNLEHAFRLVDHGPSADNPDRDAAEQFRDFWGEKAELRRFKDGRIMESVVWDVVTSDDRSHIPSHIVRHLLGRHFGVAEGAIQTIQESFDSVLRLPKVVSRYYQETSAATGFKAAIKAFDNLVKDIKDLGSELPLAVLNVSACSEYLRYTSVFVPVPASPICGYVPLMEVVLEFEKSAKWPDDLRAVQHMKLAFFERIAALLMDSIAGLKASVCVGDRDYSSGLHDQARLEIVTPQGWAFSVRIWHDREATLLNRIIENTPNAFLLKPVVDRKEYQQALEARKILARRFIHAPRHHRAITAVCHRYPAYSGTVRLVKRWLASHWLLHGHVTEEAVEIICASPFVGARINSASGSTWTGSVNGPGSKERGFSAVVECLKDWKWQDKMVVPLYGTSDSTIALDDQEGKEAESTTGVWKLSTEHDKEGSIWTSHGPDIIAANRIQALASATWDKLLCIEGDTLDVEMLFTHSTEDYDFVVHFDPACVPRYHQNICPDATILTSQGQDRLQTRPGFDPPTLFINDLRSIYEDTLKFFYDSFGGDRLGAVWEPAVKKSRTFKILGRFSSTATLKNNGNKNKDIVHVNEAAIINEIERLGKGLIKEARVKSNAR